MAISPTTIKKLFALSGNRCAMFGCEAHLVIGQTVVAEICHIRARRKNGPRYDPKLTAAQKDSFGNLLLLCPTDHTLIDKDEDTYSSDVLEDMKKNHEHGFVADLSIEDSKRALMILEIHNARNNSTLTSH
jgi:hypothetical protein